MGARHGHDITLIEVMPLGEVEGERVDHYLPLTAVQDALEQRWTLTDIGAHHRRPGALCASVAETGGRLGFITPLTNNFCAGCNRIRVTATGQLYACLGGAEKVDLRAALRSDAPDEKLAAALDEAMRIKPEQHHFRIEEGAAPGAAAPYVDDRRLTWPLSWSSSASWPTWPVRPSARYAAPLDWAGLVERAWTPSWPKPLERAHEDRMAVNGERAGRQGARCRRATATRSRCCRPSRAADMARDVATARPRRFAPGECARPVRQCASGARRDLPASSARCGSDEDVEALELIALRPLTLPGWKSWPTGRSSGAGS